MPWRGSGTKQCKNSKWIDFLMVVFLNSVAKIPQHLDKRRLLVIGVPWHDFYPSHRGKKPIMNNLLHLISIVLGTYICSVAFVVVLFRLFFPLKTKEEMERLEMEKLLYTQRLAKRRTRADRNRISLQGLKVGAIGLNTHE